jgi:hypothetical protein
MASNAVNHGPGRAARAIHWLFPSRQHLAITIAIEIGLTACGIPLWAHLLLGVLLHLVLAGAA